MSKSSFIFVAGLSLGLVLGNIGVNTATAANASPDIAADIAFLSQRIDALEALNARPRTRTIEARDMLLLKVGDASIELKKNGSIKIVGKNLTLNASDKINVKSDSDTVIKGKQALRN